MRPPLLACLTLALLAVACARQPRPTPPPPSIGADVRASDAAATCRRWAETGAERWLGMRGRGDALAPAKPDRGDVIGEFDRYDAARERNRLYRLCMNRSGSGAKGR